MSMPRLAHRTALFDSASAGAWDIAEAAARDRLAGRAVLDLGVGDPDIDTPAPVQQAAVQAMGAGHTHYAPLAGEPALREAIARHARDVLGIDVPPGSAVVCNGAQGALYAAMACIAGPGDEVVVPEPAYASYPSTVESTGARLVSVALDPATGYRCDPALIEAAVNDRTVAVLLNTPGNPTGKVQSGEDIAALVALCRERGIWLISDEVYWPFCWDTAHVSAGRGGLGDHVVVISSLSKSHAMTGWRIGWALAPPQLARAMAGIAQAQHFGINQFAQLAAVTALADVDTPVRIARTLQERRDALCSALSGDPRLRFVSPGGGMFLMLDVSETGLDGAGFATALYEREAVVSVPGGAFGTSARGYVRLGFIQPPRQLHEAARRIRRLAATLP